MSFENPNASTPKNEMDRSPEAMAAAQELAAEIMPRLAQEFPNASAKLEEYLANGFTDSETGEEFDPGERLAAIQRVIDQRDLFDHAALTARMEAAAQGVDPETGEKIHSGGTPQ